MRVSEPLPLRPGARQLLGEDARREFDVAIVEPPLGLLQRAYRLAVVPASCTTVDELALVPLYLAIQQLELTYATITAAAGVAALTYGVGWLASHWLPEPATDALPEHTGAAPVSRSPAGKAH